MLHQAQYMNPADIAPFREYEWSRDHSWIGVDEWDKLLSDVAASGFKAPAILEYNHRTGHGYLGEGNHRVGVAMELGVPVPVVVCRTRKTAPDWPMVPITEPGQYSMRDARGFSRFPALARPADIGLPTVSVGRDRRVDVHRSRCPSEGGSIESGMDI